MLDNARRVVLANPAASVLLGVAPQRLRGVPFSTLVPQSNLDLLLGDFRHRRTRTIEVALPVKGDGYAPQTLSIRAVRVARWGAGARAKRLEQSPARKQEFKLLVLEDISEKASLEHQLVETEKHAAIGQLAAGILHEVSNPLASLGSNLLFIRGAVASDPSERDVVEALDASLEQLDQMRQLLGTLSSFPGRQPPRYQVADMNDVVRRCVAFVRKDAERRRIDVTVSCAAPVLACEMDIRLIKQVLLNLIKNAMESMADGGRIDLRTHYRAGDANEPAAVLVEVADTGCGIAEADLRRVFRPLFSTKPRGAGLGLSFCRQAVEEHGGEIRLTSGGEGLGTVATISLPVRQTVAAFA